MVKQIAVRGPQMCFRGGGGGQQSMVKYHIFTFFLGPFPKRSND